MADCFICFNTILEHETRSHFSNRVIHLECHPDNQKQIGTKNAGKLPCVCGKLFSKRGISQHKRKCKVFLEEKRKIEENTSYHERTYLWESTCRHCGGDTKLVFTQLEQDTFGKFNGLAAGYNPTDEILKYIRDETLEFGMRFSNLLGKQHISSVCLNCDHVIEEQFILSEILQIFSQAKKLLSKWREKNLKLDLPISKKEFNEKLMEEYGFYS